MRPFCVYLLGAGGFGMAPLARYLIDQGYAVYGWDDCIAEKRKQQLSWIHWQNTLPENCSVCIYSSAITDDHPLLLMAQKNCLCYKRGAFLAHVLHPDHLCVVCGSHGKSTTTAYLIHLFKYYHIPVNYLLGAEFQDDRYDAACGCYVKDTGVWTLMELDESDGTIDLFCPEIAVILNADWDHPRYYLTQEAYKEAFSALALRTKSCIISNENFSTLQARRLAIPLTSQMLDFNAVAARITFRYLTGKTVEQAALRSFPGIKRRYEVLLQTERLKIISDYAHHPSELRALRQKIFQEKTKLSVVFEPHRISRLKQYFDDFATELKTFSNLYLYPLYEAFELGNADRSLQLVLTKAKAWEQLNPFDYIFLKNAAMVAFVGAGQVERYARQWIEQWKQAITNHFKMHRISVQPDFPLKQSSLMNIGGSALWACKPKNVSELQILLQVCQQLGLAVTPVGSGSNLLIPETRYDGVVTFLHQDAWKMCKKIDAVTYQVGAGCLLHEFLDSMESAGVGGFEYLDGIPGTVGGALSMNAGMGQQGILDRVVELQWLDETGVLHTTSKTDLRYGYRMCETLSKGIATSVVFQGALSQPTDIHQRRLFLQTRRNKSQPTGKCLGCFFKNLEMEPAGKILDACGVKGMQAGDIFVSPKHANFVLNRGKGRFWDVVKLISEIRKRVYSKKKVVLEPEVRILGKNWEEFL